MSGQSVAFGQWLGQSSTVRRRGVVVANNTLSVGHSTATARLHGSITPLGEWPVAKGTGDVEVRWAEETTYLSSPPAPHAWRGRARLVRGVLCFCQFVCVGWSVLCVVVLACITAAVWVFT
jgi:hypothetical protein